MRNIRHWLYLRNATGDLLTVLTDETLVSLSYGLKDLTPGVLEFTLPGNFDDRLLAIDYQVEVYRELPDGSLNLEGDTAWFIRQINKADAESGVSTIGVMAYSALEILGRRIVAYFAGTSYSDKTGIPWDDMLKEIVDENYGPGASYGGDPDRNLEPWFTVQPDYSAGSSITKAMAWRTVLNVLQDIVNEVKGNGYYCSFDVVRVGPARYQYQVFVGPRGSDHSAGSTNPVIVSRERFNLLNPSLMEDWSTESNFIYATGQGQETDRVVETAQDDARINISPFNRRELNQDARQAEAVASVQAEANSALEGNRPKRTFTGEIGQTDGCLYGIDWKWGDIVTAEYKGFVFDCYVDAVTVSINSDGTEVVVGSLRSVSDV